MSAEKEAEILELRAALEMARQVIVTACGTKAAWQCGGPLGVSDQLN